MRNKTWIVAALALSSCWKSTAEPKRPEAGGVDVALASVTLGDNCGRAPVAQEPAAAKRAPSAELADASNSGAPAGNISCEPSAMVLSLKSTGNATKIAIKRVEVLGADGKAIGELTPSNPTLWTESAYVPWDEALAAKQTAQATYTLTVFDWSKVEGGRYSGTPLTVRVTLEVGSTERTVTKQTEIRTMPDPDVVT
jgi:hypothetical protein